MIPANSTSRPAEARSSVDARPIEQGGTTSGADAQGRGVKHGDEGQARTSALQHPPQPHASKDTRLGSREVSVEPSRAPLTGTALALKKLETALGLPASTRRDQMLQTAVRGLVAAEVRANAGDKSARDLSPLVKSLKAFNLRDPGNHRTILKTLVSTQEVFAKIADRTQRPIDEEHLDLSYRLTQHFGMVGF